MLKLKIRPLLLLSLVAATALVAGGCAVSDSAVKSQAEQTHAGLVPAIEQDPNIGGYLQAIGKRIVASAQQLDQQHIGPPSHFKQDNGWMWKDTIQFHLVNSKTLNAFTTGGDHVYIYNELFQKCNSEDELAAVMCHEFAHIYCRHVQQGIQKQEWITAGAVAAGGAGYVAGGSDDGAQYAQTAASAAAAGGNFIGMGFTRGDEDQADEYGFKIYCQAGWGPAKFANFFKTMISLGYDTTPTILSDHPKLADRVAATEKRFADFKAKNPTDSFRKPPIAGDPEFIKYRQLAQDIANRTPNDTSLAKAQQLLDAFPSCVAHTETPTQIDARKQVLQQAAAEQNKAAAANARP